MLTRYERIRRWPGDICNDVDIHNASSFRLAWPHEGLALTKDRNILVIN